MDRGQVSLTAHGDHPIAAPLDDEAVRTLLDRALRPGDERLLDLGCGQGAWVVRALEHPDHAQALEVAARHRTEWLRGFRGTLGFVTLCLRRSPS